MNEKVMEQLKLKESEKMTWKKSGDKITDKKGVVITEDSFVKGPRGRIWEIDSIDNDVGVANLYDEIGCNQIPHYVSAERFVNYEVVTEKEWREWLDKKKAKP